MRMDMHCHVLPGVDDGARNMQESLEMLRISIGEGVTGVMATPHFDGRHPENAKRQQAAYESLQQQIREQKLPIQVFLGNELFYCEESLQALIKGEVQTLHGTGYVLTEFVPYTDFSYMRMGLQRLQYEGYTPVLAHMERYRCLEKEERVAQLVDMGICMQVNADTLTGGMGFRAKRRILTDIRHGLIHLLGSDGHRCDSRPPKMAACLQYLEKKAGYELCRLLSEQNPEKLIRGEDISGNLRD